MQEAGRVDKVHTVLVNLFGFQERLSSRLFRGKITNNNITTNNINNNINNHNINSNNMTCLCCCNLLKDGVIEGHLHMERDAVQALQAEVQLVKQQLRFLEGETK